MIIGGHDKRAVSRFGGTADVESHQEGDEENEHEKPAKGPSLMGMGRMSAAKKVMAAIESGDVSALDQALYAHAEACSGESE